MVLAAVFLFYSLMIVWGPIMIDDWVFLSRFEQAGGNMFSLAAINGAVDNLRISNLVEPYVLVSSPWKEIFPWVNGLAVAYLVWAAGYFISGRRIPQAHLLCFIWLGVTLFIPWRNFLFVRDYALNYPCSAALALVFVLCMFRWRRKLSEQGFQSSIRGIAALVGLCIFAILFGGWHEAPALASLTGFFVLLNLGRRQLSPSLIQRGCVKIGAASFS